MNSITGRIPYGGASLRQLGEPSASPARSGSSQIAFTYRAPSPAAVSSTGSQPLPEPVPAGA